MLVIFLLRNPSLKVNQVKAKFLEEACHSIAGLNHSAVKRKITEIATHVSNRWIITEKAMQDAGVSDEEVAELLGSPSATKDHSWPTPNQLSSGILHRGARCMDRYRCRNVWEQDLNWLRSQRNHVELGAESRRYWRCGRGGSRKPSIHDHRELSSCLSAAHDDMGSDIPNHRTRGTKRGGYSKWTRHKHK